MQLHREFQGNGLVVMSLDIIPGEWAEKDKVVKFLTEKGADFPNYILREDDKAAEAWLDKYEAAAVPALVVFDRNGRRVPVPDFKTVEEEKQFVKRLVGK